MFEDLRGAHYPEYYERKYGEGTRFEQHVCEQLQVHEQRVVRPYRTKHEQLTLGDANVNGEDWEIKFASVFADQTIRRGSQYVYFEVSQREKDNELHPSGIFATATWTAYAIGHYATVFVFDRAKLYELHDAVPADHFRWAYPDGDRSQPPSGRGFLLTITEAHRNCRERLEWPEFSPKGGPA